MAHTKKVPEHGTAMDQYRAKFAERKAGTELDVPDQWSDAPVHLTERPEWTEARVPVHPDDPIAEYWHIAVLVPRLLALGFLWVTFTWVRFVISASTLLLIATWYHSY